jgi:thiol-disulfide isomerase/thioredoxin
MIRRNPRLRVEGESPSFDGATGWLNSPALTPARLRGRVVLVDFWTYTCINWLRTAPYLRGWADKYQDRGLTVVGVHTPEFAVEHEIENVRRAVRDLRLTYPIAIDNDHAIWRAFDNRYWPAAYFVDARGRVRHHQFGEGEYERSEHVLQALLGEAGAWDVGDDVVSVDADGVEAAADWAQLRSSENYVGHSRTEHFASPGGAVPDTRHAYHLPARLELDHWGLAGKWTVGTEAAVLDEADGRIAYRFHARDLNLVMGPPPAGEPVRFRVLIDDQPPGAAHGTDVDADGRGTVTGSRLYQLIRQPGPVPDRGFEIQFLEPGVEVLVFTFG